MDATLLLRGAWVGVGWDVNVHLPYASVNHSLLEFCRQVHGLNQKPVTAGTQTLDRAWQDLKKYVPSEITAKDATSKKVNPALWDWIYSWMWRRNCKGDVWAAMPALFHWDRDCCKPAAKTSSAANGGVTLFSTMFMDNHRRKFRSQTSDNMDRWKAEQGRGREKRKIRRKKSRRERVRRKKMQMREKVGKSRNTVFFQWFGAPEGRKVGSLKRGAEPAGEMRDEKLHAVVARSPFRSQNVQNTPGPDHFWKLRCRKSARRCGAKHILKSKCTKHTIVGPLLEVAMSKKCTPLWRETHFQVKMLKTPHVCATFGGSDVEKVYAVVARSTFRSQNVQNTTC